MESFTSFRTKHNSSKGESAYKNWRQEDRLCTTQVGHTQAPYTDQYVLTCVLCTVSINQIKIRCSESAIASQSKVEKRSGFGASKFN